MHQEIRQIGGRVREIRIHFKDKIVVVFERIFEAPDIGAAQA